MHGPAFGGFQQFGYVTNDLEQAIAVFAQRYGIPKFGRFEGGQFEVEYQGKPAVLDLTFALADFDGGQIELIAPGPDCVGIYSEGLPSNGFGMHLHHVSMPFDGDAERWERWPDELAAQGRRVAMQVRLGENSGFMYIDEREVLGHYLEYTWSDQPGRLSKWTPYFPGLA
jgi:hypothetical protein